MHYFERITKSSQTLIKIITEIAVQFRRWQRPRDQIVFPTNHEIGGESMRGAAAAATRLFRARITYERWYPCRGIDVKVVTLTKVMTLVGGQTRSGT